MTYQSLLGRMSRPVALYTGLLLASGNAAAQIVLPQQDSNCLSCHSATPATQRNLLVDQLSGCDYRDSAQYDGWGWHALLGSSCPPADSPVARGAYAHDGSMPGSQAADGAPAVVASSGVVGCESAAADPDGDGWGWENGASCRVTDASANDASGIAQPLLAESGNAALSENLNRSVCIDSDGDGWGWDGSSSCRVTADAEQSVGPSNTPAPPAATPGAGVCIDSDGDGYGWNGVASCIVANDSVAVASDDSNEGCQRPVAGTTVVSSTGPVRSSGNAFYPDNGPQCVVPDNQFNGPGLAFGDFRMLNNAWNGATSSWDWMQCIALTTAGDGSVVPSWHYDWGNEHALQAGFREWEVKSYPEIIYGVKSQTVSSGGCDTTGLPVRYSDMPEIDISYQYRTTQTSNRVGDARDEFGVLRTVSGGDRNIAIESFLHSSCDIRRGANSNREFELMVWLDHGAERLPSGRPPVSVYTDSGGRNYDVYVKGPADPGYIAYVAQQPSASGSINWNEFFADARNNAGRYEVRAIDTNWCLANILIGTEIWWGEGSFALDHLQIQRSY